MIATHPVAPARHGLTLSIGSGVALVVGLGGLALLALSLLPPSALAGRLLQTAGETRSGPYTQDLYLHFGDRLRLAGGVLVGAAGFLVPLRASLDEMLQAALADARAFAAPHAPRYGLEVGALTLVALALRAAFLGQPMRYDEALSYNEFASRPLYYGLSFYPEPNNHLLNTLLVHLTSGLLGGEPWALRLPALVAGVLLVPATYGLGWLLHGSAAGLLAASLVAASSYLTEYSTNARGYTLQALAFVAAFGLVVWATRRGSRTALLLAALVAALGFWAVPTMLYGVAIIAAWLAAEVLSGQAVRRGPLGPASPVHVGREAAEPSQDAPAASGHDRVWSSRQADQPPRWPSLAVAAVLLGLVTFVLYLPVVVVSGPEQLVANRFVEPLGIQELARDLSTSLARTWELWNRDLPWPVVFLLVLGVVAQSAHELRRGRAPLAVLAVGVCLGLVVIQRVAPFERVWLFLVPLYLVLASGGLMSLVSGLAPRWATSTAVIGLACLLGALVLRSGSILRSQETGAFPDAAAVADDLGGQLGPTDAVLTSVPASLPELQFYFHARGLPTASLVRPPEEAQRVFVVTPADSGRPGLPSADWQTAVEESRFSVSVVYRLDRR